MDDGKGRGNRPKRRAAACAVGFLISCFLISGDLCFAGNRAVVQGIVGTVSGTRVFVKGKSYDLAGIPIRNPSGKELSVEEILPGRKVAFYYRGGSLSSVVVYDPMVE